MVNKKWITGDIVHVSFENEIQPVHTFNNEIALQRGAIVYALSVPHQQKTIREYKTGGFKDKLILPANKTFAAFTIANAKNDLGFKYIADEKNSSPWYNGNTHLTGTLFNPITNKSEAIKLIPMGSTVLRKVTFKTN